jgi:hypothetical protein
VPDILPSVSETDIFTALRAFILSLVGCEVIRGQVNRVAMPVGDFIELTPLSNVPLETNTDTYTATTRSTERRNRYTIQIDCYGALAGDRATTISTMLRDSYAVEQFALQGFDMAPLYAEDAHQMPLMDGEDQYLERWTFSAVLQVNPIITMTTTTADTLTIGLIDVDSTYPA